METPRLENLGVIDSAAPVEGSLLFWTGEPENARVPDRVSKKRRLGRTSLSAPSKTSCRAITRTTEIPIYMRGVGPNLGHRELLTRGGKI